MGKRDDDKDFEDAFREGEDTAFPFVKEVIKKFLKQFPSKKDAATRAYYFTALMGGFLSSCFYLSYVELEKLLKESGGTLENAELWTQKVITSFADRLMKDGRPIDCKFMIQRKGGKS